MKPWYNISVNDIIEGLKSDVNSGLTREQLDKNNKLYGSNALIFTKTKKMWKIIVSELLNIWSLFVIFFIICNLYIGYYYLSIFYGIMYSIIINFIIYYKKMAKGNSTAFDKLNLYDVHVIREGKYETISAESIVVGDIVIIDKGTYVPADMRIISCNSLMVNELPITGKDFIGEKFSAKITERELTVGDINNMLFRSSVIVDGEGIGVVVATGMDTEIGILVKADEQHKNEKTMFRLIKRILNIVSSCLFVVYICIVLEGRYKNMNMLSALKICTPIVLGALPVVTVIEVLLLIVIFLKQNKKKNIFINNLSILERLNKLRTIFLEKRGVLTEGEYIVSRIFMDNENYNTETLYDNSINIDKCYTLKRLMSVVMLCNDVIFNEVDSSYSGDDIEIGIFKFIEGIDQDTVKEKMRYKRIFALPIDGSKMIKTSINIINKKFRANIFGPFDNVLGCCTHILKNGLEVDISAFEIEFLKKSAYDMNINGMEVFAVAYRNFKYRPSLEENILSNLILVGLIGMESPIKEATYQFSNVIANLGMDSVVFTPENKLSLKHFGERTKIISSYSNVYSGVELKYMTSAEIKRIINHETLFSNLSEDQKIAIVKEHKKNRGIVCVIASRLISVPHLSQADIPISFGSKASSIVKKISNIHFETIDIRSFFDFIFSSNELVRNYKGLLAQALQFTIAMTIPILLEVIINFDSIIAIADLIYLEIIVVIISGLAVIVGNKSRSETTRIQQLAQVQKNNESKSSISSYIKKGIQYGIAFYAIYWYASWQKGDYIARNLLFIIMGLILSTFPLMNKDREKDEKNLAMYLLVLLNIVLIIVYMALR